LKEIDETVGQNQRNVGDYGKALEGLNDSISKLGIVAAITAGIELLGSAFGDTREGALSLQILFSKFTETAKVLVQSVINSGEGIKNIFQGIANTAEAASIKTEIAFKKIERATSILPETIQRLDGEIATLESSLDDLDKPLISEGIAKIGKAFEGNIDTTLKAIEEQEKFLELQLATTISISEQEKALAGLAEQRQILQDISDDDTLGFIERAKFVEKAQQAAIEFAALDNKLALTKEKLTIEAIKQDLRRAKALSESRIQAITTGEQLAKILQDEAIARKVSDANDEAFNAAFIERVDKQVEAEAFRRDQEEKNRKTARDGFEQELDIIEEFGEKRIALNQKVIDSDESSLKQRQAALKENEQLEDQLFQESIQRIIAQGKASIDLRKDLSDAEKQRRKDLLDTADIQKIVNAQTETERLALIKKLDLGEIETNRLKESIKINNDLTEARRESTKALDEASLKTAELKKDIELQKQVLKGEKDANGELIELEDERLEDQKENLQTRIDLLEKDSVKRLELEKQLNDLKLQEQEEAAEKAAELEEKETAKTEKEAEKRAEAIQKAAELITAIIEKQNEKRLQAIDEELEAVEERQNTLRTLAENGNEEAVKSLAESEKKEAQIRAEKEKELQRQQRIEAGLAAFQVFAANAGEDPSTALTKTFTDITALTAFIGSLPSFFVGTEDTGTVSNALDSNGGRLSVLHDNERVMTAEQNKKIGGMSNEELTKIAVDHKTKTFRQFENITPISSPVLVQSTNENLSNEIKELTKAVKANKPINPIESIDHKTGMYKAAFKAGNTNKRVHKSLFHPKRNK